MRTTLGSVALGMIVRDFVSAEPILAFLDNAEKFGHGCDVTRSVSKMTENERRGGKRWDKPKKAEKSRDCGGGKF